jgi:hypothetical protein
MSKTSKTSIETAPQVQYLFEDKHPEMKFAWVVLLGKEWFAINDYDGKNKILNPELKTAKASTVDQFWSAISKHGWPTIQVYRNGNYHAYIPTWPQIAGNAELHPPFIQFDDETGNVLSRYNHEGREAALAKRLAWGQEQASSFINR